MQPKIVEKNKKRIFGYEFKCSAKGPNRIPEYWAGIMADGRHKVLRELAGETNPDYGIMYPDDGADFCYVIGVEVGHDAILANGLSERILPGGTYAAFETKLADIGQTWSAAYKWLNESNEYKSAEGCIDFELYDERMCNDILDVCIHIVKK